VCTMYAVVRETGTDSSTDITVCGGERREKAVYLSEKNVLVIEITNTNLLMERPYFVLKYEGKNHIVSLTCYVVIKIVMTKNLYYKSINV